MNPFELTKDPDGGGITVRVKHGFVVLTREEERRVTERITEILAENEKLREEIELVGTAGYLLAMKQLKDENEKLRQQLADVTESVGRLEERCAELRKLSADQYQCSLIDGCYECEWGFDGECVKHLERRMKELGVKQ